MNDKLQDAGVFDVRELPPHERHGEVFLRFDGLKAGEALTLVIDHDPTHLLYQFQSERSGAFEWAVLERGPPRHRIEVSRRPVPGPRGVNEFLTQDHRRLETIVDEVERLARTDVLDLAARKFAVFRCGLERHMAMEERVLFPVLERGSAGGPDGPMPLIGSEHRQIRHVVKQAAEALAEGDTVFFQGIVAELRRVLDVHNLHEEHRLSPLVEQTFTGVRERDDLVRLMQAL